MKLQRCKTLLLLLIVGSSLVGYSQKNNNTHGNLVAYFGEDKKVEIHEGRVIYRFDKALYAKTNENYRRSITPSDRLAYNIFNGTFKTPVVGEEAGVDPRGNRYVWEEIAADDKGVIKDRKALSGHLYTSFTSEERRVMLLECAGPTMSIINGFPHEGDHYNYGYTITPFVMEEGNNSFLFTPGRFGMLKAQVVEPSKPVLITKRDILLPDLLIEESGEKWGAIRVINASEKSLKNYSISVQVSDNTPTVSPMATITPVAVRKVAFKVADRATELNDKLPLTITILDSKGRSVDSVTLEIKARTKYKHHERTFVSGFDGSVQYYSVAPSTTKDEANQAMFLSVHGASVQARNQARAYKQKDWGYVVAPTNRRPHGFAWEEWGRLDAIEVLEDAEELFQTDKARTYLTGHSMGGHGSWYLGATYPDRFAAIAPCAGYPELLGYARPSNKEERVVPVGEEAIVTLLNRSTNVSRTKKLVRNYLQSGIYILHGDSDNVVPTAQAQDMRELLGTFQKDMAYYEYPGGKHWYGSESVDFAPIFDYFKWHKNPAKESVDHLEFYTANPGVNAKNHWITIQQQEKFLDISNVLFDIRDREEAPTLTGTTKNIKTLIIDLKGAGISGISNITVDNQLLNTANREVVILQKSNNKWSVIDQIDLNEKSPIRSGGFKNAFTNRPVLVYATHGSKAETAWYYNRARFDAETFYYRGNSSLDIISDTEFKAANYPDRNVVIYGNSSNNSAWNKVLSQSDIQVTSNSITVGTKELKGDNLGCFFIQPRTDSTIASVGVVAGTGERGMKSIYHNQYFVAGNGFPDIIIVNDTYSTDGIKGVKAAGFFGNNWKVESGELGWR